MDILDRNGLRGIHLTSGKDHDIAVKMINSNQADGINFNYVDNWPQNLDFLKACPKIKYLQINHALIDYEVSEKIGQLKLPAPDGKLRETDSAEIDEIARILRIFIPGDRLINMVYYKLNIMLNLI